MAEPTGTPPGRRPGVRNPRYVRPTRWQPDATDRQLVELLLNDGRMPNAELARRLGLPESSCSARLRALREHGVVTGVHADVDLAQLGRPMEAMAAVRFSGHKRAQMDHFRALISQVPGVIAAYHVAGDTDFLVHVCTDSPHALRDLVLDRLTCLPGIAQAQTSLIFERVPGTRSLA